ncbi:MAG: hypothetical protein QM638_05895 [Nocardioides sp.]|uniref:hypothetical protein n=1 Tax=Nocardioides sp. TaxID=35761 RepID=UPI0039E4EFB1
MSYSFDNFAQYLIDIVDGAIDATMHLNGYGGNKDDGYSGGDPLVRVAPLGGRYVGSTFEPGGRVTDPTGQYESFVHFRPEWPFDDIPSMQNYYWKRVNELFEDWYRIPAPTPPGATPGFDGPIAGARTAASALAFSADKVETPGNDLFGGDPQLGSALQNLDQDLDGMDGYAIRTFKLLYADPLEDVTASQEAVACALWIAVVGEQKVWAKARQGIADIAGQAAAAMKSADGRGGGDLTVLLDVIGSVADVAGLIPGVSEGAKAVSTINSVLKTAYSHVPKSKPEHQPLQAGDPLGVLSNVAQAIETLKSQIRGEEDGIRTAMTTDHDTITDGTEQRSFSLGTPQLLGDTTASDYRTSNDLEMKLSGLKFVATEIMPILSGAYRSAEKGLDDISGSSACWARPSGIGIGATGPFPEVSGLASTLAGYLADNARNIDDAASVLEIVGRDIHKSDVELHNDLEANRRRLAGR